MWNPLQNLLTAPSSTPSIKTHVLWIIGTAVQNNPSAQASVRHPSPLLINLNQLMHIQYLSLSPLPTLLSFLHPENASAELRSKAAYALSGLLKHNAVAVKALDDADGWSTLRSALEGPSSLPTRLFFISNIGIYVDSNITVRRKTAFLLNTLILSTQPSDTPTNENIIHPNSHASMLSDPLSTSTTQLTLQAFRTHGLLEAVINALVHPTPYGPDGEEVEPDGDFEEKAVRILVTYASAGDGFEVGGKEMLNQFLDERSRTAGGDEALTEHWGLSAGELGTLRGRLR